MLASEAGINRFGPVQLDAKHKTKAPGLHTLAALLDLGRTSTNRWIGDSASPIALAARLRGTGPGVSFTKLVTRLESEHPLELAYPFEGSPRVGGAAWQASELLDPARDDALAKLHWKANADDLPMHVHTRSSRFIIVLKGRGFFHVTSQPIHEFDGTQVRTIAARERDVLLFGRNIVHTFSTREHSMTLLSCHYPFIPLDDASQYALPAFRWTADSHLKTCPSPTIELDGWTQLA